jgi:hypothetical protein
MGWGRFFRPIFDLAKGVEFFFGIRCQVPRDKDFLGHIHPYGISLTFIVT